MPLTASHAPLLTLHMLWIDLSKSFMTFSRAVGQLLQAKPGVPALFLTDIHCCDPAVYMFIFQSHGHPIDTLSPWYSHPDGYRLVTIATHLRSLKVHAKHCGRQPCCTLLAPIVPGRPL